MGKIELIDTGRLTEKQARLNMEKCAEFLARMIQKYGDVVLGEIEERNAQLPVFLRYGNRIGEGGFWGSFFGRSASWRRLVIPIYFMYGNRMTMGNRNEVKI